MSKSYSKTYDYSYFCGANVTLSLNTQWVEDAVGISYSVMNSQTPVYGYCSMLFDAVAPGQKLVQGSFLVNFRSPNYVYLALKGGRDKERNMAEEVLRFRAKADELLGNKDELNEKDIKTLQSEFGMTSAQLKATGKSEAVEQAKVALKQKYYGTVKNPGEVKIEPMSRDVTLQGPFDITIAYSGVSDLSTDGFKQTIYSAYIVGHGAAIQIDENVILEEYNFFARDLVNG